MESNIQKEYKKEKIQNVQKTNRVHKIIVHELGVRDRVYKTCNRERSQGKFWKQSQVQVIQPNKMWAGESQQANSKQNSIYNKKKPEIWTVGKHLFYGPVVQKSKNQEKSTLYSVWHSELLAIHYPRSPL